MQIYAVDAWRDLFRVEGVCPDDLVNAILTTEWSALRWQRQEDQQHWRRRRIDSEEIAWIHSWDQHMRAIWPAIESAVGRSLRPYSGTAWWLDEPGFVCDLHTDGEMPGAMQLTWIGVSASLGTAFYHYRDPASLRYQFPMQSNTGYIILNQADQTGYRHLQWHGMLTPVPDDTYRLNSYSWIFPL